MGKQVRQKLAAVKIPHRLSVWLVAWAGLFCDIVKIITFTRVLPSWDFQAICYFSDRELEQKMVDDPMLRLHYDATQKEESPDGEENESAESTDELEEEVRRA